MASANELLTSKQVSTLNYVQTFLWAMSKICFLLSFFFSVYDVREIARGRYNRITPLSINIITPSPIKNSNCSPAQHIELKFMWYILRGKFPPSHPHSMLTTYEASTRSKTLRQDYWLVFHITLPGVYDVPPD